ncbi:hypothetical protein [Bradyrhizobium sp. JR3.5]
MAGLALSMALPATDSARAQTAPPALGVQSPAQQPAESPQQQQIELPPASVERENPGLINEIGKLFEKSKSALPSLKSPGETINDLSNIARPSTMVTGRAACVVASNGAPDCKIGADRLCQSKGFKEGKSIDTDALRKMLAAGLSAGPQARAERLQDGKFRDTGGLPIEAVETASGMPDPPEKHDIWMRFCHPFCSAMTQYLTLERLPCWYDGQHRDQPT